ncbi:hypothetical protein ANCCEY_07416 [Ancylostoma ceylanicum]|uniref:Uncharacterized protein n=1 Tax=Ancylostoma ceylanicum TaxID=53326 RepID=A0A0D6M0T0_9BILA|nr:hypothetical protein ANCCEY_07416 [Ancylostoma ceylanicum]
MHGAAGGVLIHEIIVYISEAASEAVVLTMPINRLSNPESARLYGLRLMYMHTIQVFTCTNMMMLYLGSKN